MNLQPSSRKISPLYRLNWRFECATEIVSERATRCPELFGDDHFIHKAAKFLRCRNACGTDRSRERLRFRMPGVWAAFQLYESEDAALRSGVEARLLAGQPHKENAAATRMTVDVIDFYARVFLDVADRREARDFIFNVVIQLDRKPRTDDEQRDKLWKLVAYQGGVAALESIMHIGCGDDPLDLDKIMGQLKKTTKLATKAKVHQLTSSASNKDLQAAAQLHRATGGSGGGKDDEDAGLDLYHENIEAWLRSLPYGVRGRLSGEDPVLDKIHEMEKSGVCFRAAEEVGGPQLEQLGIAHRDGNGQLALTPKLARDRMLFLQLYDAKRRMFDIITEHGSLRRKESVFATWCDETTQQLVKKTEQRRFFGVPSVRDVSVFRSLGFGATPVGDLAQLNLPIIQSLTTLCGEDLHGSLCQEEPCPLPRAYFGDWGVPLSDSDLWLKKFNLLVVGCSLARETAEVDQRVLQVAESLSQAEKNFGIEFTGIRLWLPQQEELDRLRYLAGMKATRTIRDVLTDDLLLFLAREVAHYGADVASVVCRNELTTARGAFLDALDATEQVAQKSERIDHAKAAYQRRIGDTLVEPILRRVPMAGDPSSPIGCKPWRIWLALCINRQWIFMRTLQEYTANRMPKRRNGCRRHGGTT